MQQIFEAHQSTTTENVHLSADQIQALCARMQAGIIERREIRHDETNQLVRLEWVLNEDAQNARAEFAAGFTDLAWKLARKHRWEHQRADEVVGEVVIAMLNNAPAYDPSTGSFWAFINPWARAAVRDANAAEVDKTPSTYRRAAAANNRDALAGNTDVDHLALPVPLDGIDVAAPVDQAPVDRTALAAELLATMTPAQARGFVITCGLDTEHPRSVEQAARDEGVTTGAFRARMAGGRRRALDALNVSDIRLLNVA